MYDFLPQPSQAAKIAEGRGKSLVQAQEDALTCQEQRNNIFLRVSRSTKGDILISNYSCSSAKFFLWERRLRRQTGRGHEDGLVFNLFVQLPSFLCHFISYQLPLHVNVSSGQAGQAVSINDCVYCAICLFQGAFSAASTPQFSGRRGR